MADEQKKQIAQRKLLIVEGRDEKNFFEAALAGHLAIADIQVLDIGGEKRLTANLEALKVDAAFPIVESIGVIRDADLTPPGSQVSAASSAFDSVRGSLVSQGVQLPCPAGHGQFAAGPPRVGVFIMPDGVGDGMLETLCCSSVSGQGSYICVNDFFACLQAHGALPNNMHKARPRLARFTAGA